MMAVHPEHQSAPYPLGDIYAQAIADIKKHLMDQWELDKEAVKKCVEEEQTKCE